MINGLETEPECLDVGALLFGTDERISDPVRVSLNTQTNVTEDALDVRLTSPVPTIPLMPDPPARRVEPGIRRVRVGPAPFGAARA